ncbi:MAG: hypothetical protein KH828_09225 [Clostridiales bacterium]|nr:hypothetical protein [Clostridiales bacterium]
MITLSDHKVILRDFLISDIEKRIYWETTENEWQLWDAPWETENLTESEKEKELCRKPGIRQVRGNKYDGLTFRLNMDRYQAAKCTKLDK